MWLPAFAASFNFSGVALFCCISLVNEFLKSCLVFELKKPQTTNFKPQTSNLPTFANMIELPVIDGELEQKPKKPNWLRVKLPIGEEYRHVRQLVDTHKLHTICESGNCPNMGECWGAGTALSLIHI